MAKKQSAGKTNGQAPEGENISQYFRTIFEQSPNLLKSRSNDELMKRWLADHPGESEVPKNIKANLSNIKSVLRSKGRKKTAKAQAAAPAGTKPAPRPARSKLETLEERIDDVLTFARTLDRDGLDEIILHLRKARNTVVWKMGQ